MKNNQWKVILSIFVVMIGGGYFLFSNEPKSHSTPPQVFSQSYSEPSYSDFVGAWNDKVRAYDLSEEHLLSSTNNESLLDGLKQYTDDFSFAFSKKIMLELQSISQDYPHSIWSMYKNFLLTYTGKNKKFSKFNWKSVKSSEDIQKLIQNVTGKNDYDESIKLILASSDPCAYFNLYKSELRKRGLSRNYKTCSVEQIDQAKFPNLANLIR